MIQKHQFFEIWKSKETKPQVITPVDATSIKVALKVAQRWENPPPLWKRSGRQNTELAENRPIPVLVTGAQKYKKSILLDLSALKIVGAILPLKVIEIHNQDVPRLLSTEPICIHQGFNKGTRHKEDGDLKIQKDKFLGQKLPPKYQFSAPDTPAILYEW